jgi:hypothetical protein
LRQAKKNEASSSTTVLSVLFFQLYVLAFLADRVQSGVIEFKKRVSEAVDSAPKSDAKDGKN